MEKNETILVIVLVVAFFVLFSGFGMNGFGGYGMGGMMQWMFPSFGFMWFFGLTFWVLLIVALVLLIMWLTRQLGNQNKKTNGKRR